MRCHSKPSRIYGHMVVSKRTTHPDTIFTRINRHTYYNSIYIVFSPVYGSIIVKVMNQKLA